MATTNSTRTNLLKNDRHNQPIYKDTRYIVANKLDYAYKWGQKFSSIGPIL